MREPNCIFCQIVTGEKDAAPVFETSATFAFLDVAPLLHGHCLLVPKTHVKNFHELPPSQIEEFFTTAQLLARAIQKGMVADGTFIAANTEISQSVPHFHLHIVPRWKNDGLFSPKLIWKRRPYRSDEMQVVQKKIISSLKS